MKKHQPLGPNQITGLHALVRYRTWPGGWILDTNSFTRRVLNSLVRRGLAVETDGSYQASRRGVCALMEAGEKVWDHGQLMHPACLNWKSFIIQFPLGEG